MTGPHSVRPAEPPRVSEKQRGVAKAVCLRAVSLLCSGRAGAEKFDGSAFKLKAPEPNAKSGGVLSHGMPLQVPHFDIHQAGTIFILRAAACMFDNLIRRDPRDSGKTIIPDLAHSWEIAKDGKTYTFHLRKGVQFHDGAELTSEDVKATFDRITKPPQGVSIPRSILFKAVSEITAPDKYTVEFKLSEPRPINFMMSAIASGWNVIVRKKTLEDNNYNLRKVEIYPGTGPFRSVRRVVRTKSGGDGAEPELLEHGAGRRISTASSSITSCRFPRKWDRQYFPTGSTMCASPIRLRRRVAQSTPGLSTATM